MTEEQSEQKAEEYSEAFIEKGVAKASFIKGVKFGLKQHSHDYLAKTINLKKKYESQLHEKDKQIEVTARSKDLVINNQLEEINMLKEKIADLEAQIEKMKSDIKQLRENRMNDDTDQNIMDRLWEEWTVNFGVSN